jgi:hypothetical protein
MLHRKKIKAKVFESRQGQKTDFLDRLRYAAACKLCTWHEHEAGGGSVYITIGTWLTLRFADHERISTQHGVPDFNFVNRLPTDEEIENILQQIDYPALCRKTAFALHIGLTVPKLARLLTPECVEDVCEDDDYPNTYTKQVVVATAFRKVAEAGITQRIAVSQELRTCEDYCG